MPSLTPLLNIIAANATVAEPAVGKAAKKGKGKDPAYVNHSNQGLKFPFAIIGENRTN